MMSQGYEDEEVEDEGDEAYEEEARTEGDERE